MSRNPEDWIRWLEEMDAEDDSDNENVNNLPNTDSDSENMLPKTVQVAPPILDRACILLMLLLVYYEYVFSFSL